MLWSQLEPVLVALAIGAMIGAERERSHRNVPEHFGGVRTFAVLAVAGSLAQLVSTATVAVGLGAFAMLIAAGSWRSMTTHPGSTTVVTALTTYLLGAMTEERPQLAVGVAVVTVAILMSKDRVHRVLRERVTDLELEDAVKLAVVALVILPLLPDRGLGPYGVLNPFRIWLLVVAITGIGWVGYIGVRVFGARRGLLVSGAAGGFVSASATTGAMGRIGRQDSSRFRSALVGALAASVSTMAQLLLVVGVGSPQVARRLALPALAAAGVLIIAVLLLLRSSRVAPDSSSGPSVPVDEPDIRAFALRPALVLAAVITTTVLISRWAADQLGRSGIVAIAALAGLADGHAGAVSAATLAAKGEISVSVAVWAASASIGANTLVKLVIAFVSGGRRFGVGFAVRVLLAALAFVVVQVVV